MSIYTNTRYTYLQSTCVCVVHSTMHVCMYADVPNNYLKFVLHPGMYPKHKHMNIRTYVCTTYMPCISMFTHTYIQHKHMNIIYTYVLYAMYLSVHTYVHTVQTHTRTYICHACMYYTYAMSVDVHTYIQYKHTYIYIHIQYSMWVEFHTYSTYRSRRHPYIQLAPT